MRKHELCLQNSLGVEPDEVRLVASASAGVNSVARAFSFRERQKVVLGESEFPTMGHKCPSQANRGAKTTFLDAQDKRSTAKTYEAAIDRETLIGPLTHVCFRNGFRSPVSDVVRIAHECGALVLLDDQQDCSTRPVDVKS